MINVRDVSSFLHVTRNILILVKFIVSAYNNAAINVMERFENTEIERIFITQQINVNYQLLLIK